MLNLVVAVVRGSIGRVIAVLCDRLLLLLLFVEQLVLTLINEDDYYLLYLLYNWTRGIYQLADVVAPRQEEHAGVVLLPVSEQEREHDSHQDVQIPVRCYRVVTAPEHRVHSDGHQQCRPAVKAVVKQLS